MNDKLAKRLRRQARQQTIVAYRADPENAQTEMYVSLPPNLHVTTYVTSKSPQEPRRLDPSCTRARYRELKRQSKGR